MRARRHTATGISFPTLTPSGRLVRDAGLVVLTFVVGYGISALWISPASMWSDDRPIPRVLGLAEPDARTRLAGKGFRTRIDGERTSPAIPRGAVIWQDPPPGMVLSSNTTVQLVLSAGPALVSVPDVVGLALSSAERILVAAGVKVGTVDTIHTAGELGVVIATRPGAGNGRPRGSTVDLVVSGGDQGGL